MATFERFFVKHIAEILGQEVQPVLGDSGTVSIAISDKEKLSDWHCEATFIVSCSMKSKTFSEEKFDEVEKAINRLPMEKPLVMNASLIAQDVDGSGGPRKWIYTGMFKVRYHTEDTY